MENSSIRSSCNKEDNIVSKDEIIQENKKSMELLLQSLKQKQKTATAVPAFPGLDPTAELLTHCTR